MFRTLVSLSTVALLTFGASLAAYGQRGVGERVGMARQGLQPPVVSIEGKLLSIETGPCEKTTGFAGVGTHLILEDETGKSVNLHLGAAAAVASYVKGLQTGDTVVAQTFRTDKMAADHYVAVNVTVGDQSFTLRDETLRPFWAGQRGSGARRGGGGCPWGGPGGGRGYGSRPGNGYGAGYGYRRWNSDASQSDADDWRPGRGYGGGRL